MNPNQVTIVTGASRGIGRAIALKMASSTSVLVVGRNAKPLEQLCAEIVATGGSAHFVAGDVSNPETAQLALNAAADKGWTVRNLVCNAGIAKGGVSHTFDPALWQEMFAVNVNGAFWFAQACLPLMVEAKAGTISIISSIAGLKGVKYDTAYSATKHALIGMASSLALEYAKHGIVVVPICPGFVDTDMTDRTIAGIARHQSLSHDDAAAKVAAVNPQRRIIPASEVADAVALVCSNTIPSLNGRPLVLTGGL